MGPNRQVSVFPKIPGEVLSVYFSVGDAVKAGDVLFTIDAADIKTNIATLEAQLAVQDATVRAAKTGVQLVNGSTMQSQLLSAENGVFQTEAGIIQAQQSALQARIGVEQAQLAYDMASQSLSDSARLFAADVISKSVFEQAEAAYLNTQGALERAVSAHEIATIGLSTAERGHVQSLEGQRILSQQALSENRQRAQDALEQAEAARNTVLVNLETARNRLEDAAVTAPISGAVITRSVNEFGIASPQSPSFVIADNESMVVTFRVPRHSAEQLAIGDDITILEGINEIPGRVTEIAPAVDMGGLLTVKANIPNPPEGLLSGMSVRVLASAQYAANAVLLPISAIHHDRGTAFVFVAENGTAKRVAVEVGIFNGSHAQIISGVSGTEQIISTWSSRLSDGMAVEISSHTGGPND
jgi:RND family efflux transporter MFP subunit